MSFLYKTCSIPDCVDWWRSSESLEQFLLSLIYHAKTINSWNLSTEITPNMHDKNEGEVEIFLYIYEKQATEMLTSASSFGENEEIFFSTTSTLHSALFQSQGNTGTLCSEC